MHLKMDARPTEFSKWRETSRNGASIGTSVMFTSAMLLAISAFQPPAWDGLCAVAAHPPTPRQRLAPEGTYFFLKRASLNTESSIIGFAPGTKVTMIEQRGSTSIVSDGEHQFETASSQLTNDLDIAARAAKADFEAQRKIGEFIAKTVQEHDKQQAEEIATFDKQQAELERKLRSANSAHPR